MNPSLETLDDLDAFAALSEAATRKAARAFARLLKLAEERDSGQIPRIARFLAAAYNGRAFPLDLFELPARPLAGLHCVSASLRGPAAPRRGVHARLTAARAASRLLLASSHGRVAWVECIATATHCPLAMKTATLPSLRVEPELREAAESVLEEGETLSGFIEASVRETIQRRRVRSEFIARGLASREEAKRTGVYINADVVHAELAKKLAQARTKLQKKARA